MSETRQFVSGQLSMGGIGHVATVVRAAEVILASHHGLELLLRVAAVAPNLVITTASLLR